MTLTRHLYAVLGLATILSAVSFSSGHITRSKAPNTSNVTVVNTNANPVPVNIRNTAVPVSGTVNIANAQPLLVRDPGPANRQYISKQAFQYFSSGSTLSTEVYTVPAGKQLEIKDIYIHTELPDNEVVLDSWFNIIPFDGLNQTQFLIALTPEGLEPVSQLKYFTGSATGCTLIAPPQSTITVASNRSSSFDTARIVGGFTGYLEDAN